MFGQLELLTTFNIERETLCRWLLAVKKNYRPEVIYHNWRHAWSVAQVMFSCLINSGWLEHLGPLTSLGLIVSCLCHDLDHRGQSQFSTNKYCSQLGPSLFTKTRRVHFHFIHLNEILYSGLVQIK